MEHKNGCIVCGSDLIYTNQDKNYTCYSCKTSFKSNVVCDHGHYVCDACHSLSAYDYIEKVVSQADQPDPVILADEIMKHPSVKMHGPEHHFLVPAVLIASYYNHINEIDSIKPSLEKARKRSEHILGGFCGTHGSCGAGIGAGIFFSIITKSTPLKTEEWKLSNMLTGVCLLKIAEKGGPRCCKRDTYTAIHEAIIYCNEKLNTKIPAIKKIRCNFSGFNKECLKDDCEYYTQGTYRSSLGLRLSTGV